MKFKGLGWCIICMESDETNYPIIIFYGFVKHVQKEIEGFIGLTYAWFGDTIEYGLKIWCEKSSKKPFREFPFIIVWGIWLTINIVIFDKKVIPQVQCAI